MGEEPEDEETPSYKEVRLWEKAQKFAITILKSFKKENEPLEITLQRKKVYGKKVRIWTTWTTEEVLQRAAEALEILPEILSIEFAQLLKKQPKTKTLQAPLPQKIWKKRQRKTTEEEKKRKAL